MLVTSGLSHGGSLGLHLGLCSGLGVGGSASLGTTCHPGGLAPSSPQMKELPGDM